ncbi:MAG TPA: hypothetical protein VNC41_17020 [Acidimicrobiia bacterium]|nr:hypothetical protein [Acidimicrobiia bacterium]
MNARLAVTVTGSLDDLELELRKLPGVRAAGFEERDDMLLIQLHIADKGEKPETPVPVSASRIAARHSDKPVAVEIVRWRTVSAAATPAPLVAVTAQTEADGNEAADELETDPRRARLLAVLAFPDTDELEVHLILEGRRTIGRAAASTGLVGAVEATIDAVRELGAPFEPRAKWARALDDTNDDDRVVVAVALEGVEDDEPSLQYGLAAGASPIDAAARSTLDALNRRLSRVL